MIRDDVFGLAIMAVVFVACAVADALVRPVATWEDDALARRMAEAQTDDPLCDDCRRVTVVRELVMRERAALLLCARCADITKYQRKERVA
jgi:hypothetical protein